MERVESQRSRRSWQRERVVSVGKSGGTGQACARSKAVLGSSR